MTKYCRPGRVSSFVVPVQDRRPLAANYILHSNEINLSGPTNPRAGLCFAGGRVRTLSSSRL